MKSYYFNFGLILLSVIAGNDPVWAVKPEETEFSLSRQWFDTTFGVKAEIQEQPFLQVIYEDAADGISRGHSWRGTPFQLADIRYQHGIAFNASKNIRVFLGKPGELFQAEVGLENNDDTRRGAATENGSVTFQVRVGEKEVFHTPILRLNDKPIPVQVPLEGATEFEIRVGDAGDGRGWDQALWAEATVRMKDGTRIRLQDLPLKEDLDPNAGFGFSFNYAGKPSASLLAQWRRTARELSSDADALQREIRYVDPQNQLEIRIEAKRYKNFPTVEWVIHFKNNGSTDTPILDSIQAVHAVLDISAGSADETPVLMWSKGAVASFDDFAPQETPLSPGKAVHLQPGGGRSSSQVMPFFNLGKTSRGKLNGGVIAAIGWSGEWAAEFEGLKSGQARLRCGMAKTHLVLHPGEEIRTPSMALLFYRGDRWRGQNLFRQFVLAHHRPQVNGKPLIDPITCGNWGGTAAAVHLENIQKIVRNQLPIDYYWIDAEWYGKPGGAGTWPVNVGDWNYKKDLYPQGFRPLSEALKASNRELMLWFEPERVYKDTPWWKERTEWLFKPRGDNALWNLGHPEARKFLTDFISAKIDEFGLGCYRQDFNIEPLPFWQAADAPDRVGISEIRHIEGLYAFWDELLRRHPGLIIDNCASGGRRIDLETLGRATPFWRTDGPRDPVAHQCHTYGLMMWAPLSSTSQDRAKDDYEFRSSMCSGLCLNWWVSGDQPAENIPDDFPYAWCRQTLERYLEFRKFYYGDYYPLTPYTQSRDAWMAYQLDLPDAASGLVVALKREQSPYLTVALPLQGLQPTSDYRLTNMDTGKEEVISGKTLMEKGLRVTLEKVPDSALIRYQKQ